MQNRFKRRPKIDKSSKSQSPEGNASVRVDYALALLVTLLSLVLQSATEAKCHETERKFLICDLRHL